MSNSTFSNRARDIALNHMISQRPAFFKDRAHAESVLDMLTRSANESFASDPEKREGWASSAGFTVSVTEDEIEFRQVVVTSFDEEPDGESTDFVWRGEFVWKDAIDDKASIWHDA